MDKEQHREAVEAFGDTVEALSRLDDALGDHGFEGLVRGEEVSVKLKESLHVILDNLSMGHGMTSDNHDSLVELIDLL